MSDQRFGIGGDGDAGVWTPTPIYLDSLVDTVVDSPTDGLVLTYEASSGKWKAKSAGAGADTKTYVYEAGVQIGTVARFLNFDGAGFNITEDVGNDWFLIEIANPGISVHDLTGAYHTEDATGGAGNFLKADSATTFSWQAHGLVASDVGAYTTAQVDSAIDADINTHAGLPDVHHAQAHTHDGDILQIDGINSDGGAFAFDTTGAVTFNQDVVSQGDITLDANLIFAAMQIRSGVGYIHIFPTIGNEVGQLCIMPSGTEDEAHLRIRNSITANWGAFYACIDGIVASLCSDQSGTGTAPTTLNINSPNWDIINIGDVSSAISLGGTVTIGAVAAGVADYDKFLVSDSGVIKFRTGAEAYADMDGYVTADFTTDFAAESLANLAARAHGNLSDAPTDAHHSESHVLSGGTHTATGLTVGWVISADSPTTFSWKAPTGGTDPDAIHDNVSNEIQVITGKGAPVGADVIIIEDSAATWQKKSVLISNLPAGSPSFGLPVSIDIGDAQAEGSSGNSARADHQHAFAAPGAGYPLDVAATESDGVATTASRSDHVHAHGTGYSANAHHNQVHVLSGTDHTASGLTIGHAIIADSATTFSWQAPSYYTGFTTDFAAESLANLTTRNHGSLSDAPADAHHVAFVLSDFTTAFAAESLANLTTRAHSNLSDAPTDAHHNEAHVLATTGPHTDTLPVADIANGTQYQYLRAGASNPEWQAKTFTISATLKSPAVGYTTVWRAPFGCTCTKLEGRQKGGTSTVINCRYNGTTNVATADLTLTAADTWYSTTGINQTTWSATDWLEIEVQTLSSATEITFVLTFTEP